MTYQGRICIKKFLRHITVKFCQDENFKVMDLKAPLTAELEKMKFKDMPDIKFRIPFKLREAEADGQDWACGYVAKRMRDVQPLGKVTHSKYSKQ